MARIMLKERRGQTNLMASKFEDVRYLKRTSLASDAANNEPQTATTIFLPDKAFSDLGHGRIIKTIEKEE